MEQSAPVTHQPAGGEVCKFYARGDCKFGAKCKKTHAGAPGAGAGVAGPAAGGPGGVSGQRDRRPERGSGGAKQPCRFFMSGSCKFAAGCKFDHVTVNRAGGPLVVPTAGAAGGGGQGGERAGGERKGRGGERGGGGGGRGGDGVCWFFLRGECKNGESCRFSHSPQAVARAQENGGQRGHEQRQPCRFFLAGSCNYGKACNFAHVIPGDESGGMGMGLGGAGGGAGGLGAAGQEYQQMEFDEAMFLHQQMMQQQMMHYAQQQAAASHLHQQHPQTQFFPQ